MNEKLDKRKQKQNRKQIRTSEREKQKMDDKGSYF